MKIATEPIGSIPRPQYLQNALAAYASNEIKQDELDRLMNQAVEETIKLFEDTGSPVITDGEQTKPSFVTYPVHGLSSLAQDGVVIPFADGHTRQLPRLTASPFTYQSYASSYLTKARSLTSLPVKQSVISVSALSLLYPADGLPGYTREQFIADLIDEAEKDIRACFDAGAHSVQIDFTDARLAIKLDPSKELLKSFIDMNNQVLERLDQYKNQIGIHSCPGGDHDSTHSADVTYADLLPELFRLKAGSFYLEYAAETDRRMVLELIQANSDPSQKIFLGVTDVLNPRVETPEEIMDMILEAASVLPVERIGTTDDCGFSPFADDTSTSRDTAFAKIRARVEGTALAEKALGL
ncbi:MAG TPA: cobalamin-independent methionine synthase II family protein [Chitinophaga sp.]|uniref:cobalamin-independent methionine synthase II family protein n=1 Tax=Chitinophaga sp. TaxID=1869181 RepID=UPI002BA7752C|nr:cobalamin-independent methionine synthase II family protein [Chitinophaga sp.]HVI43939.1 cobalamin-independent methionine synthase II family protein [Chitinophaga sp.]